MQSQASTSSTGSVEVYFHSFQERCKFCADGLTLELTDESATGVSNINTNAIDALYKLGESSKTDDKKGFWTKADLDGASPLFNTPVYRSKIRDITGPPGEVLCQLLTKTTDISSLQDLQTMLTDFVGNKPSSAWISDTLPLDLNLPMTESTPDCMLVQAFVICKGLPPVLVSVYDGADNEIQRVNKFTAKMSKQLTSCLLNFCHCYFDIVPCSIASCDLSAENVWATVKEKQERSRPYCGRQNILTGRSYAEMRAAVVAVTGVSYVPCFLQDPPAKEVWLLLLDPEWRRALSLIVEKIAHNDQCHVTFKPESKFKVKVAVLEAAKRQSFVKKVTVFTPEVATMTTAFERLQAQTDKDIGVKLRLSVQQLDCTLEKDDLKNELVRDYESWDKGIVMRPYADGPPRCLSPPELLGCESPSSVKSAPWDTNYDYHLMRQLRIRMVSGSDSKSGVSQHQKESEMASAFRHQSDAINCPSCQSLCLSPTILPCGHLLCRTCLRLTLENKVFNPACLLCSHSISRAEGQTVSQLADQLGTDLFEDLVMEQMAGQGEIVCLVCPNKAATKVCVDCGGMYCDSCLVGHKMSQHLPCAAGPAPDTQQQYDCSPLETQA